MWCATGKGVWEDAWAHQREAKAIVGVGGVVRGGGGPP